MDWALTIGVGFLIWLLADALTPLLHPVFRAAGRLYAPPHGAVVLALTWIAAIAATTWALMRGEAMPRVAAAAAVLSVPIALLATVTWRDFRRAAQGQPPVHHTVPARFGTVGRILAFGIAVLGAGAAALLWPPAQWDDWLGWIGCASAAAIGAVAAITGKVPALVRAVLGISAPAAHSGSSSPPTHDDRNRPRVPQN